MQVTKTSQYCQPSNPRCSSLRFSQDFKVLTVDDPPLGYLPGSSKPDGRERFVCVEPFHGGEAQRVTK